MGPVEAMGYCVHSLETLLSILALSCSMKASSVIDCCFLLGGENPPSWCMLFCFQSLLKCKKPLMSFCSSVSFLLRFYKPFYASLPQVFRDP